MRDGVKRPAQLAGSNIVGANVAGRRRESFGVASTEDHQVLVNDAGAGEIHRLGSSRRTAEIFTQVDAACISKRRDRFARGGVQSVDEVHDADEDAPVFAVGPVGQTAIRLCAANSGVELPQELACCGIQRENFLRWSDAVEQPVDDNGACLKTAFFLSVKTPGDSETLDVVPIDLRECGIVIVLGCATVCGTILLLLAGWPESGSNSCCAREQS